MHDTVQSSISFRFISWAIKCEEEEDEEEEEHEEEEEEEENHIICYFVWV